MKSVSIPGPGFCGSFSGDCDAEGKRYYKPTVWTVLDRNQHYDTAPTTLIASGDIY